jgi:hypothetical protein
MTSDLIVHVVGAKADLASSARAVQLDYARRLVKHWVSVQSSSSGAMSPADPSQSPEEGSTSPSEFGQRPTTRSNASRSLSFLSKGRKSHDEPRQAPIEPLPWCEVECSEVSAKDDYGSSLIRFVKIRLRMFRTGIEDLFLRVTTRLVQKKAQIERERVLRSRDSVMLSTGENDVDPAKPASWSCC